MFGTLYIPMRDERFALGLDLEALGANNPYRGVADIYCEPIRAVAGQVRAAIPAWLASARA